MNFYLLLERLEASDLQIQQRSCCCTIYPAAEYTSESVANALKDFLITYGAYDVLQSDPGSDGSDCNTS